MENSSDAVIVCRFGKWSMLAMVNASCLMLHNLCQYRNQPKLVPLPDSGCLIRSVIHVLPVNKQINTNQLLSKLLFPFFIKHTVRGSDSDSLE